MNKLKKGRWILRLVCISDTHNRHHKLNLPEGDCLLHCGDLSESGSGFEILSALRWMSALPYEHKLWIAGNHDLDLDDFEEFEEYVVRKFPKLIYLKDSEVVINGMKFYGAPWTSKFNNWGFELDEVMIEEKWSKIPDDVDVLMTHSPPEDVLDKTYTNYLCGCSHLRRVVDRIKPKLHVFGHIHESFSMRQIDGEGTIFVNASIQDYQKNRMNSPIVIEL